MWGAGGNAIICKRGESREEEEEEEEGVEAAAVEKF
jgi:hypothetical protein